MADAVAEREGMSVHRILVTITVSLALALPVAASTVPCQSSVSLWCLDWEPYYQVWDPDGNKDYQDLPEGVLTATLIDRKSNQLLVGPVQIGDAEPPLVMTMVLDERIESGGWSDGIHLHSSSEDEFDLRLMLHAAPQYTNPELAFPNQDPLSLEAEFNIGGALKLGDEEHVWLFPAYWEVPVTFNRLRAAESDSALGFGAYVDFRVANRRIEPETLTLYIDADADGDPERTIVASPLSKEEHDKLIVAAQAKSRERAEQMANTPVTPADGWNWEWLSTQSPGNTLNDVCRGPDGDLLAVDAAGFVLRRHEGIWRVDGDQLDEALLHIVTAPDGEVFVASTSRIWRREGKHWIDMQAPEVRHIRSVHAWEGRQVIAAAIDGEVLQYGPSGWRQSKPGGMISWTGVWGVTPDDVWMTEFSGSIFRFDGRTWAPLAYKLPEQTLGVWGFGAREVYFATSDSGGGRVWRWSGEGRWQQLKIPNIPWAAVHNFRGTDGLIDFSTGGRIVSIGRAGWEKLEGMPDYALKAFCRDESGHLVGVGEGARTWKYGPGGWSEVDPRPLPLIRSVWGLEVDDLYAVCDDGRVWRWDGMKLAEMDSLTEFNLQSIWGLSSSDVHVAGVSGIWHWDGRTWTQTWEPWQGGIASGLELWGSGPRDIWAVGSDGAMVHFDGSEWRRVAGVTEKHLWAIWGNGADDVYVGGDQTLVHFDGNQWSAVPGFKRLRVSKLWGSGPADVWAATDQGLYRYDGRTWEPVGLGEQTTGIWGTGPTDVFTLSEDHLLHFDGRNWSSVRRADAGTIRQLWGRANDDLLAIGDNGSVILLRR